MVTAGSRYLAMTSEQTQDVMYAVVAAVAVIYRM
jgi:hypothetical protein